MSQSLVLTLSPWMDDLLVLILVVAGSICATNTNSMASKKLRIISSEEMHDIAEHEEYEYLHERSYTT